MMYYPWEVWTSWQVSRNKSHIFIAIKQHLPLQPPSSPPPPPFSGVSIPCTLSFPPKATWSVLGSVPWKYNWQLSIPADEMVSCISLTSWCRNSSGGKDKNRFAQRCRAWRGPGSSRHRGTCCASQHCACSRMMRVKSQWRGQGDGWGCGEIP